MLKPRAIEFLLEQFLYYSGLISDLCFYTFLGMRMYIIRFTYFYTFLLRFAFAKKEDLILIIHFDFILNSSIFITNTHQSDIQTNQNPSGTSHKSYQQVLNP